MRVIQIKTNTIYLKIILIIYVFSLGFLDILTLPVFNKKVQIPELVFCILLLPFFIISIAKNSRNFKKFFLDLNEVDKALCLFWLPF